MFKILLLIFPLYLYSNLPIKIIAIYNNELAFRVDINNYDMKLCLKEATPLKNKLATIKWYINQQLKVNVKITSDIPTTQKQCNYSNLYFDGKLLIKILKKKHLIK